MHKIVNTYKEAKTQFYKRLHKQLGLTNLESDLLATIYFFENCTSDVIKEYFTSDFNASLQNLVRRKLVNPVVDEFTGKIVYNLTDACLYFLRKKDFDKETTNDAIVYEDTSKVRSWRSVKTLIHFIYAEKKNRKLIWLALLFSVISAGLASFAIFPMADLANVLGQLAIRKDLYSQFCIDLGIFGGAYLLQLIFLFMQNVFFIYISENMGFGVRRELFTKIQLLPFSYLDKHSAGNIMSLFTNDMDTVIFTIVQNAATIINALFTVIGMAIVMFLFNEVLAAIVVGLTFSMLSIIFIFIKKSQPHFADQQKKLADINGDVLEAMGVHKMLTVFDYQEPMAEKFDKKNKSLGKSSYFSQLITGVIYPYNNFVTNFIIGTVSMVLVAILIGDSQFLANTSPLGKNAIEIMFTFIIIVRQFTTPISNFFFTLNSLQLAFAATDRVNRLLNEENETSDANKGNITVKNAEIQFKDVSFRYNKYGKNIINNLNLTLKPNTVNAIAGPTGSGKTTIISLLSRFYDINEGKILVDGVDISKVTRHSLRENISIVLQDSYLFSTSILENIRCGQPNATREEVIAAAKLSNAHEFIMRLPQGYDTKIDNGIELISEGEKQLIAIARAFLSKAKIIIFDEATSYVDTKTEKDIQEAMKKLMKNRTSILIAHRLSTIKDADQIAIIKDGVLIEKGNHQELMRQKGFYYQLNTSSETDMDLKE